MTEKLYYEDSYLECFKSKVLECKKCEEGYRIVLEKTAFYPEGGGQPSDRGNLNEIEVNHVFIKENVIYHMTNQSIDEGVEVEGRIDFRRRWDYMQQHSGEHILSGIIKERYGYSNVGFHLGDEYMTADFDGEISREEIIDIENRANEIVFSNVPIEAVVYSQQTLAERDYRSKIEILEDIRLVTIQGCDVCACCGTHLRMTGEIGMIKILASERHRGGIRMTIVCGARAVRDYQSRFNATTELSGMLSVKQQDVVEGVKKIQDELGELKQILSQRMQEVLEHRAERYTKTLEQVICIEEKDLKPEEIRKLCLAMMEKTASICAVLVSNEEQIRYAVGAKGKDIRNLCKKLNQQFEGKGGGKEVCQGNLKAGYEEVAIFLRENGLSF
ncbi:MAG: alanyl-tRNA editing protein [Cellulosilyticaceae bacterium]